MLLFMSTAHFHVLPLGCNAFLQMMGMAEGYMSSHCMQINLQALAVLSKFHSSYDQPHLRLSLKIFDESFLLSLP